MECTLNSFTSGSFPTKIRATAVAFCWNFTAVAFGGSAPIISMWLIQNAGGSVDMVGYYLMGVCFVTITGIVASIALDARVSGVARNPRA
jgi:MHS family proline/betaine transporter-like MFS transporter